jgi:hypothetical protein
MIEWVYAVLIGIGGFFLGTFVISLCAIARCSDCRAIGHMFGVDKP